MTVQDLERTVFDTTTGERDNRNIRIEMFKWLRAEDDRRDFMQMLREAVAKCNGEGECKYLYFNEHTQRAYLDNDFLKWAKWVSSLMEDEIEKLDKFNNQ